VIGAGTAAHVDQYLAAVHYLDNPETWPFNRDPASNSDVVAGAIFRALSEPWENKDNGHGYLLVWSLGVLQELNPGITDSGDLLAWARGVVGDRSPRVCDLCERPIDPGCGRWLPVASPPTLIVLAVCEFDAVLLRNDFILTWLDGEGTPRSER